MWAQSWWFVHLSLAPFLSRGWKMGSDSEFLQNKVKWRKAATCNIKEKADTIKLKCTLAIFDPFIYVYCSTIWQTSISSLSIKVSLIGEVVHLLWLYNKLEVSTNMESKEIKLQWLLLPGLPCEHGLYNISSVLTPFILNYLAAVKTNQSNYSTVSSCYNSIVS